jgi:hypothetical protein
VPSVAEAALQPDPRQAKLRAGVAALGRRPRHMARLDYEESLVVHVGRAAWRDGRRWREPGWHAAPWAVELFRCPLLYSITDYPYKQ